MLFQISCIRLGYIRHPKSQIIYGYPLRSHHIADLDFISRWDFLLNNNLVIQSINKRKIHNKLNFRLTRRVTKSIEILQKNFKIHSNYKQIIKIGGVAKISLLRGNSLSHLHFQLKHSRSKLQYTRNSRITFKLFTNGKINDFQKS